ncbi:MAG: GntR family transcriptional regulator, partial [Syntrophales bacterium]
MDELIKQKSLAEHIVEDLEQKIISRTLKPGQRIIEETLCRTFGVSRSPVREAFQ